MMLNNFYNSKVVYMGDLKASERLKNNSFCITEGGFIRNIKDDESLIGKVIVHVDNMEKVGKETEYIEKDEYVRYKTVTSEDTYVTKDEITHEQLSQYVNYISTLENALKRIKSEAFKNNDQIYYDISNGALN